MKFDFEQLLIWLDSGKIRTLKFAPNKINIITGGSNTGKTAILDIIDYCLFASRHNISDSIINENSAWYGIRFHINKKLYLIARKSPVGNTVSNEYYFSSIGDFPQEFPEANISESAIKTALETEFGIDSETKIAYGGRILRANSKISLRYFLLLNTISQNIITHSEDFFDRQHDDKYREALPRTFDLAVGIDTAANIAKREKKEEIDREIKKLEREKEKTDRKRDVFYSQITSTIKSAKEFALIPEDAGVDDSISLLKDMVEKSVAGNSQDSTTRHENITSEINEIGRKIRNLHKFTNEYSKYKENLKEANDSLKPIEYLAANHSQIIKTSIFEEVISSLSEDHEKIKKSIATKTPLDSNISDIIRDHESRLTQLHNELAIIPAEVKSFESDKKKFVFIGETKAKLELYVDDRSPSTSNEKRIEDLKSTSELLIVESVEEKRALFIRALEDTIQEYIILTKAALVNYGDHLASFNYKEKKLQLRKPKADFIENIGSSSNHMFMHLFLFLGLHELILRRKSPYVPPFLIIDQFSRPYWGEGNVRKTNLEHSDIAKVKVALNLLDTYISNTNALGGEFQMIIFEHINKELWKDLPNVHLVEEFLDGNALIRAEDVTHS